MFHSFLSLITSHDNNHLVRIYIRPLYPEHVQQFSWSFLIIFFSFERCLPPNGTFDSFTYILEELSFHGVKLSRQLQRIPLRSSLGFTDRHSYVPLAMHHPQSLPGKRNSQQKFYKNGLFWKMTHFCFKTKISPFVTDKLYRLQNLLIKTAAFIGKLLEFNISVTITSDQLLKTLKNNLETWMLWLPTRSRATLHRELVNIRVGCFFPTQLKIENITSKRSNFKTTTGCMLALGCTMRETMSSLA